MLVDRRAQDIVVLDVSKLSSVADRFVICSGTSRIFVQALVDALCEAASEPGLPGPRVEGYAQARWVCLDFGDIVVHVFLEEVRRYFDLERLWGDAPKVDLPAVQPLVAGV